MCCSSKACQKEDWKGFHKQECKELGAGANQPAGALDLDFLILKRTLTRDRHYYLQMPQAERMKAFANMGDTGVFTGCGLLLFSFLGGKAGKYSAVRQGIGIHDNKVDADAGK